MKRAFCLIVPMALTASVWAAMGGFLHERPVGSAFRQLQWVRFPPAVSKVLVQDGQAVEGWGTLDSRRPYCILEARSVSVDAPLFLMEDFEYEVEFVDHKWLDLPYGAAYATSFHYKGGGDLKSMTCLKPSNYAEDYMTLADFEAVAGGLLGMQDKLSWAP